MVSNKVIVGIAGIALLAVLLFSLNTAMSSIIWEGLPVGQIFVLVSGITIVIFLVYKAIR